MAGIRISQLPAGGALQDNDLLPIARGNNTFSVKSTDIFPITEPRMGNNSVSTRTLSANVVSLDKIRAIPGNRVLGNNTTNQANVVAVQVSEGMIANDAVTSNKIKDGEVKTINIGDNQVTLAKMEKIAGNRVFGNNTASAANVAEVQVSEGMIANDAVTSIKIKDGEVKETNLGNDSVTRNKIKNGEVIFSKIQQIGNSTNLVLGYTNANTDVQAVQVNTSMVADNAITTAKIGNFAVTRNKIAENSIDNGKMANAAVGTVELINSAVTTEKIADDAITTVKIDNFAVTRNKIAENSIDNEKMANAAVGTVELINSAVTAEKIANGAVTAEKIANGAVTTAKIANDAVTISKIGNAAVGADQLAGSAVTSAKIEPGAVTSGKIANGAVSYAKLSLPSNFPIQMIQVVKDNTSAISTNRVWEDIPGISLAITRLDTSGKVRVQAVISYTSNSTDIQSQFRIVRGSTAIGLGDAAGSRVRATASSSFPHSDDGQESIVIDFIDTPGSNLLTPTYKIQIRTSSNVTAYINRQLNDVDNSNYVTRTISTLTLTELAG